MNNAQTESIAEIPSRAIFGPLCIIFSVALLYLKESPFFASLAAAALLGILLCWKWERSGLMVSLAALSGALFYEWQWSNDSLTLWEFGLASSLGLAFFTTFLAKQEIGELIEDHALEKHENLQSEYVSIQEVLRKYEKVLKEKNQKIELLEQGGHVAPASLQNDQGLLKEKEEIIKEKEALIASLQRKEAGFEDIEKLQNSLHEAQENRLQLQNVVEQQQKLIKELELRVQSGNANHQDNASLDELIQRYEAAIHERNLIIDELNERLDKIDSNATQSQVAYHSEDGLAESLRLQLADYDQIIAQLERNLQEKSLKVADLQEKAQVAERAEHLQGELLRMQAQLDRYETALQEKNVTIEQLQEKAQMAERAEHLQGELLQMQAQLDDFTKSIEDKNARIAQLEEIKEKIDLMEEERKEAQKEAEAYRGLAFSREQEMESLSERLLELARIEEEHAFALDSLKNYEEVLQEKNKAIEVLEQKAMATEQLEAIQLKWLESQENLRLANESYHDIQEQYKSLQVKYEEACRLEELALSKDRHIQQLEENYRILRDQIKEHESFHHVKLLEKERSIEKHVEHVRALERQLAQYTQKFEHYQANYVARELIEQYELKIQGLTAQLDELVEKLRKVESEKDNIEKDLAVAPSLTKELTRIQGMYKQLRTQFEEKSKVLNETRKELFLAIEGKNKLELEFLELQQFDRGEEETALEQYIIELSRLVEEQEKEIEALHQIVEVNS
ncbi:MAG: hypothetical protein ACSNEK_04715 [Parachlamydiaceae bacterium]